MRKFTDDELKKWVKISEHALINSKGEQFGKVAVLKSHYSEPVSILEAAIKKYVGNNHYYDFIDMNMDDPWTRVIISCDINDNDYR